MLRSIGKQFREPMQSVLKKKREAMVERICRKGSDDPVMASFHIWAYCTYG